ncbi:hypothetical protein ACA910_018059 [Epithemia clementina (nom. ined.)]
MLWSVHQIVGDAVVAHLLTIFYARRFVWQDLAHPLILPNVESQLKSLLIFLSLHFGACWHVHQVHLVTLLLAIPQLYRLPMLRDFRVILGPLTPLLAVMNVIQEQSTVTLTSLALSLTGFVILRPDNTQVLDLLLRAVHPSAGIHKFLASANRRRKLHGVLAMCNTAVAAMALVASSWPRMHEATLFGLGVVQSLAFAS